jgi:DNA recombination protein RmuC
VESYNESVGTLEARVLPSARKMREKGATGAAELAEVEPLDRVPRALHAPELLDGGRLL